MIAATTAIMRSYRKATFGRTAADPEGAEMLVTVRTRQLRCVQTVLERTAVVAKSA